jgi:hypothetical protein
MAEDNSTNQQEAIKMTSWIRGSRSGNYENTVLKTVTVCTSEGPEVSEKHSVSIFRVEEYVK